MQPTSPTAEKIPYSVFCDRVRPGDVVVFTGKDIPSYVVKAATQSEYVHVSIVMKIEQKPDQQPDQKPDQQPNNPCSILIAESHIDTSLPSVGTGACQLGVQLQWLDQRLCQNKHPVHWAALHPPLNRAETLKLQAWLWEIEQQKTSYDFVQAIGAGLGGVAGGVGLGKVSDRMNATDLSTLFCSELVTQALKIVGRVFPEVNPSKTTPAEVMALPCLDPAIEILHPF